MSKVSKLGEGKLPIHVLGPVLKSIERGKAVVPAAVGVDVGVTKTHGKFLVSSSDPITGADSKIGWHAVHVSANDVATSGIMPDTLTVVMMFPPGTKRTEIESLMCEVQNTAGELGITVAGGHTEITPGLKRPIVVTTCFGSGDKFVTSANAKASDSILMTKTAGIEGTSILSAHPNIGKLVSSKSVIMRGRELIKKLSIIPEARKAFSTARVHAMHDVTEGGILGAVFEMSRASKVGFEIDSSKVPVDPATKQICECVRIDPLKLIGSGSLLISCRTDSETLITTKLRKKGVQCSKIGKFVPLKQGCIMIGKSGKKVIVSEEAIQDELWPALHTLAIA